MSDAFGPWLRHELNRREWSQTDLARRVGTSSGTVSDWIRGVRVPIPDSCERIADALLIDVDDVLVRAGHRPPVWHDDEPDLRELIAIARAMSPANRQELISFARWRMERMESLTHVG